LEALCNIAAAEFLMPTGSFLELKGQSLNIDELLRRRAQYEVSTEALLIRTVRTASDPVAIFCSSRLESGSRSGRYRLDYTLASTSSSMNLPRGFTLPDRTLAAECIAIGYTAKRHETWAGKRLWIECVGIPPYPGAGWPRVAGIVKEPNLKKAYHPPSITYLRGDALEPRGDAPMILAHIVNNTTPNWGGGFARAVRFRIPQVQEDFKRWAELHRARFRLGESKLSQVRPVFHVLNMIAQEGYGSSSSPRLRYAALQSCLIQLGHTAASTGASVQMPRIGTGQGGGSWEIIEELIRQEVCGRGVPVTVYDLPPSSAAVTRSAPVPTTAK
jgi:O-acetyl-ADP-ribose deacetylase (regulator of RNase III)